MEALECGEARRSLSCQPSPGGYGGDSRASRADRDGRRIPEAERDLAGTRPMARGRCAAGDSHRDVRASCERPIERGAAPCLQESRFQIRRPRSRRTAKRKSLASPGGIMNQIRWDRDREARTGIPEVVYGPGKTSARLREIFEGTTELRIASRLSDDQMQVLSELATIYPEARMAVRNARQKRNMPAVPVITAGTADIPVALEAATTLEAMGVATATHFDVGVAGIHRLQAALPELCGT